MCMKYVNANIQCFNSIGNDFSGRMTLRSSTERVRSRKLRSGKYEIDGFSIVVFINIRGSSDKDKSESPIDRKQRLDFIIRLTKNDDDPEKRISYNLREFDVDFSKPIKLKHACFDYYERTEIVQVDKLTLDSAGAYTIKVLVKSDQNSDVYDVQIGHSLFVE